MESKWTLCEMISISKEATTKNSPEGYHLISSGDVFANGRYEALASDLVSTLPLGWFKDNECEAWNHIAGETGCLDRIIKSLTSYLPRPTLACCAIDPTASPLATQPTTGSQIYGTAPHRTAQRRKLSNTVAIYY
jgi:hypothetical protein